MGSRAGLLPLLTHRVPGNGWSDVSIQTMDSDFYASFLLSLLGVVLMNFWLVALAVAVVIGHFQMLRSEKGRSGFVGSK